MKEKLTLLILMLILVVGSSVFFSGCAGTGSIPEPAEIKYDIRGQWTLNRIFSQGAYSLKILGTFSGDKKEGNIVPESGISGIYRVGGNEGVQVEFYFSYYENGNKIFEQYHGHFVDEDNMIGTGTMSEYFDGHPSKQEFAWSAIRN
ncbi:MAG TPA: hypothetical protein VK469_05415 [Candidatus Kapabacteria bacterium]|nr:hypothetical protein [Candidatus Kapabacteria bacterium]